MQNIAFLSAFIKNSIENSRNFTNANNHPKTRVQFNNIKKYIDDFLEGKSDKRFIYLSGIRGVGKSTLLFQLQSYLLKKNIPRERILCFSARNLSQLLSNNFDEVTDLFVNNFNFDYSDEKLFIFVDEAHVVLDWFDKFNVFPFLSKNLFVIFSGSFTLDFQKNIDTTSEAEKELIYPLSFKDYLAMNFSLNINESFSYNLINAVVTGNLNDLPEVEKRFYKSFSDRDLFFGINFEKYLIQGAFLETMNLDRYMAHKKIYKLLEDILEKDIFHNVLFDPRVRVKIFRMLAVIAFQKIDVSSKAKIARFTKLSYSQVKKILTVLNQNQLIFYIEPDNIKNVKRNRSTKFYFSNPNFNAAINSYMGNCTFDDDYFLNLIESLIVSILFKIKYSFKNSIEICYPYKNSRANFLLMKNDGEVVPIEFGYGKKPKRFLLASMNEYESDYGILISDAVSFIKKTDDIIHIPLTTFSLI